MLRERDATEMAIVAASFLFRRFRLGLGRGVNIPEAERQLGEGLQEQPQDILAGEIDADLVLTFEPQRLRADVQVDPIQGVGEADTRARVHGKTVDRAGVAAPPRYDTQRIYSEVIPTPVAELMAHTLAIQGGRSPHLFGKKNGVLPTPDAAAQAARPVLGTAQALGGIAGGTAG